MDKKLNADGTVEDAIPSVGDQDLPRFEMLGEAGGVAWCELWGKKTDPEGVVHDVKINLTARAFGPAEALNLLVGALKVADEVYQLHPYQKMSKPPEMGVPASGSVPPAPASGSVPPAGPGSVPPAPVPPPSGSVPNTDPGQGEFLVDKMVVAPRADGKTKLDFFCPGHQYPDISAVMTPDQLSTMLSSVGAWTPDHFAQVASYQVKYLIKWKNSDRLNSKGNPYKNIFSISAG